jgi:hypothetical protein
MSYRRAIAIAVAVLACATTVLAQPGPGPKPGLMVICPADWVKTLDPYVQARGAAFNVRCLALEDLLAGNEGADAPERIKRLLHRAWQREGLRYALLVGDADTFPVRWMALDRNTEPAHDYAFYASDLYYADLAKDDGSFEDWNGQREGFHAAYYGEVRGEHFKTDPVNYDGISYVPEIAVGRWPVSTVVQLQAVIAKTLEWEHTPRLSPRAVIAHAEGWVDERERLGKLADALGNAGWEVDRQFYGDQKQQPTPQTVRDSILAGKELVLHAGHGSGESWDRCLGPAERDALAVASPGIFMSVGCGTGRFAVEPPYEPYLDATGVLHRGTNGGEVFLSEPPPPAALQPGRLNPTGLGERLLLMPRSGAVAYIGCNTGAQPCALSLLDGFVASIANGAPCVGDAWREALAHYWQAEKLAELQPNEDWYPPSIFFQGMKFMFFGDPALALPGR